MAVTAGSLLIRNAEIPRHSRADVRVVGGQIGECSPRALAPRPDERVIEARGGALLPGLHDHHLHLLALAAALGSVRCGPPEVQDAAELERALRRARPDARDGWIRGVGYHDSVAGPLERGLLDAIRADIPLRVQHRSGALWSVNSAGLRALGLTRGADAPPGAERGRAGEFSGRLLRLDDWLHRRLPAAPPPDLARVGRLLAQRGVTGVTDATPHNDGDALALFCRASAQGALPQRLQIMGGLDLPEIAHVSIRRGAHKIWLADAALPSLEWLCHRIEAAHAQARGVAIHCVTRAELVLAAAALAEAGARAGDRIEHASVAPPDLVSLLAELPVEVVTQPNFLYERGDAYAEEVEAADRPWLYRCLGFLEAGIPLGAGTDAPFGDPDPWRAMQAAVDRRSARGRALGSEERLTPEDALALFLSPLDAPGAPARRIEVGAPADLCLLDRPWREARKNLAQTQVVATLCRGTPVWEAL